MNSVSDERLSKPSASEFERIMNCDGYLGLKRDVENQQVRPNSDSAASTKGTELHALNESGDVSDATYSEADVIQIIRDRELTLVKQWCEDLGIPFDEIKIEREVRLWFMDACSAKLDVLVTHGSHGYYLDTKTGKNPVPPPSRNWQMRVGAICAKSGRNLEHVRTAIVNVFGTLMPPCDYPLEDLLQIGKMVSWRLTQVEQPGLPTKLGQWCSYCPNIHVCDSQRDQMAVAISQRATLNWNLVTPDMRKPLFLSAKMAVDAGKAILDQLKADLIADPACAPGLSKKPDGSVRKITDCRKAMCSIMPESDRVGPATAYVFALKFLDGCSISLENFTTLYRDTTGASKEEAEAFLAKCSDFITTSPRSGSIVVEKD